MNIGSDKRMWSITAENLSECLTLLFNAGIQNAPVRNVQKQFRKKGIYPARDLEHLCSPKPPDIFFTYVSDMDMVSVQEIVWQTLDFACNEFLRRNPQLQNVVMEPLLAKGIRIWVDFVFIDQSSKNIVKELEILPWLLQQASVHCVLGNSPLERAWCCYEIALFNQHCLQQGGLTMVSFIAPSQTIFHGWEHVLATEPGDKLNIEKNIIESFPGGMNGFTEVMQQANAVAVLPITEGHPYFTPSSLDNLYKSFESWYDRNETD